MTNRRNITPFEEISLEIDEIYEQVSGVTSIESEAQHNAATKLYDDLNEAGRRAEELRKDEVKPFDDGKKEVQKRFHPLIGDTKTYGKGKVPLGKEVLEGILTPWRNKVAEEKLRLAEEEKRQADEKLRSAEEEIRNSAGDLERRELAESALKSAKKDEVAAEKSIKTSTANLGLRTSWRAELVDLTGAIEFYWRKDRQSFVDLVQRLADRDTLAGAREIRGFLIKAHRKAK